MIPAPRRPDRPPVLERVLPWVIAGVAAVVALVLMLKGLQFTHSR